jgi:predicted enzyme related to lactoylglutathione lyase
MGNPVIWFEIGGHDAESLRAFYGELFGWTYEVDNPMDYASVDTGAGGAGIPGGIWSAGDKMGVELGDYVTVAVGVPDIDTAVRRAEELGAKAVIARYAVPNGPTVAYLRDPEGHLFALVTPPAPVS